MTVETKTIDEMNLKRCLNCIHFDMYDPVNFEGYCDCYNKVVDAITNNPECKEYKTKSYLFSD